MIQPVCPPLARILNFVGMDTSTADHLDRESDYGSDFTADEEEILKQLLLQQQPRPPIPLDPDFDPLQADLDRDENIHRAAVSPRTSHRPRDPSGPTAWRFAANKTWTSISLEGYGSTFTARMSGLSSRGAN